MGLEDIKKEIEKVEKEISNIPNKKNWYNFIHNSEIDSQKIKLENQLKELNEQLKAEQENEDIKNKAIEYFNNIKELETEISDSLNKNECCLMLIENVKWFETRRQSGEDVLKLQTQGILYFTNERLIFKSKLDTKNIKINTIIETTIWQDGVEISRIKGKNILFANMEKVDIYKTIFFINTARSGGITITKTKGD